jgi:hypothetical protein
MRLAVTGTLNSALFDSLLTQCAPCVHGEDRQLEIDLSSADWAYPSGLVPFASLVRILSQRGVRVAIVKYPNSSICSYYCRCKFFERIAADSPCADRNESLGEDRAIVITELEQHKIEKESLTALSKILQRLPKGVEATEVSRKSFIDACGEFVSNTRHAYEKREGEDEGAPRPKALLQAQFYPKAGIVELCVCDCGWGIKRSMEGEHHENFVSHREAVDAALVFRNRNPIGDGEGLGLSALHTYIKKNGGTLRIRTGDALKTQHGSKDTSSTEELPLWNGTIVALEILVEKSADLSKIQRRLARVDH